MIILRIKIFILSILCIFVFCCDARAVRDRNSNVFGCNSYPTNVDSTLTITNNDPFNQSYRTHTVYKCTTYTTWFFGTRCAWGGDWNDINDFSVNLGLGAPVYNGDFHSCGWEYNLKMGTKACYQSVNPEKYNAEHFRKYNFEFEDYDPSAILYTCVFAINRGKYILGINYCQGKDRDPDLIGCVKAPNNPAPPIFNDVIYPTYKPLLEVSKSGYGTFEKPEAKITMGTHQPLIISYDMLDPLTKYYEQNCGFFIHDPSKKYCVTVDKDNPHSICAYEDDIKDKKLIGCSARPAIILSSSSVIVPYHKIHVVEDKEGVKKYYQGVIPLAIKGKEVRLNSNKIIRIGKDKEKDKDGKIEYFPIILTTKNGSLGKDQPSYYALIREDDHRPIKCDLLLNTKEHYDSKDNNGREPCELNDDIIVEEVKYTIEKGKDPTAATDKNQDPITEIIPITSGDQKMYSNPEIAILTDYKVKIKTIVPHFFSAPNREPFVSAIKLTIKHLEQKYKNCSIPQKSQEKESEYYIVLSDNRDTKYCYCGKENSGCELSEKLPSDTQCVCSICEQDQSKQDIQQAYCPGYYPNKYFNNEQINNSNPKDSAPYICIASAMGWDFLSNKNSIFNVEDDEAKENKQFTNYPPDLVCTRLPGCDGAIEDPGTNWPEKEIELGATAYGKCNYPLYMPQDAVVKYRISNNILSNNLSDKDKKELQDLIEKANQELITASNNKPYVSYSNNDDKVMHLRKLIGDGKPEDFIECTIDKQPEGTCFGGIYGNIKNRCEKINNPNVLPCKIKWEK